MNILNPKYRKRLYLIIANSANTLITPVFYVAISLLVIRLASVELWGAFVYILIVMNLANHIMQWGSNEHLLRSFSKRPGETTEIWQSNIISRLPLVGLFLLAILFVSIPMERKLLLMFWGCSAFLYQSCQALVVYRRKFLFSFLLETGTIALMVGAIFILQKHLQLNFLISLFALTAFFKFGGLAYQFREEIMPKFAGRFEVKFYQIALPFFILGFSGMLQSKVDLYCVAYFLTENEVGHYQVFINLLIYVQVIAGMILQPFLKNIYRVGNQTIQKISFRLFLVGLLITLPALTGIYFLLSSLYHFQLTWLFLGWGGFFILPIYFYLPKIYRLYKNFLERKVFIINLLGIIANLILNIIFIKYYGLIGAIMASAAAQWIMLIAYIFYEKNWLRNSGKVS